MNREGQEFSDRDRDAMERLHAAGIGPGSKRGLVWRFRYVDRLPDAQIAKETGVKEVSVRAYASQVNTALRAAGLLPRWAEDDDWAEHEPEEPIEDEEEDEPDPLLILAAFLLQSFSNPQAGKQHNGFAASCSPVVSVWDVREMLLGGTPEWLPVVPRRGRARNWREHVS